MTQILRLRLGDSIEILNAMEENSLGGIICDPPYGLEFMGEDWDTFKTGRSSKYAEGGSMPTFEDRQARSGKGGSGPAFIRQAARRCKLCGRQAWSGTPCQCDIPQWEVDTSAPRAFQTWSGMWLRGAFKALRPGAMIKAFCATRTQHRLAAAMEESGFLLLPSHCLEAWAYGSGFPKSTDVSKSIDRLRHDGDQIRLVTAWIRDRRKEIGIKNKDLDEAFGFVGMSSHWTTTASQPAVPTLEQVPTLLQVLQVEPEDVPEDIWELLFELNGRKGQPGDSWFQREVVGKKEVRELLYFPGQPNDPETKVVDVTAPATAESARFEGHGTALKPAWEPVVVGRKPSMG